MHSPGGKLNHDLMEWQDATTFTGSRSAQLNHDLIVAWASGSLGLWEYPIYTHTYTYTYTYIYIYIYIHIYIDRRVRLNSAQLNHDLIVARGLWDSGFLGIPDIYIYIDPRVRLKSAQLNHDLIVARGLWVSGNTGIPLGLWNTRYIHIHRS